jgi:hypothetical protein
LAITYGEFGAVLNTQDNTHVAELLNYNAILELDGLSSSSDKTMFSEALTLYLYRYRLAKGPQKRLTNMIILEEAHNLLLKKSNESKESVLETSIRMVRQYGLGYLFIDQSASLLSKVAFANSYATIALSQKLRSDVQAIASAMNLTDEQKQALNTLPVGSAVVRLADEHPEPFLVRIPLCRIREGCVSDKEIKRLMAGYYTDSAPPGTKEPCKRVISPVPLADKNNRKGNINKNEGTHPPSPKESEAEKKESSDSKPKPPYKNLSREEIRFLADIVARPLSTTVSRYQRLNLSRRRGNAIRRSLGSAAIIQRVTIPTRCGQAVLYELTELGRGVCSSIGIDTGPKPRESLEHRFWVHKVALFFRKKGYEVSKEHPIKGNGAVDLLAERPGEKVAVEVETGKSSTKTNLKNAVNAGFDRTILVATAADAVVVCQRAIDSIKRSDSRTIQLFTWLDIL